MPTPAIQTLINDAQQVLNLDSISAVRSVVAVSLANANTGTPLNPNLTTQQLWNEFYQVVTRSKSDIESIIANQLMKFLYSPPAPGGVGANKQVIFNDNGILAGDAGLTYDKATDSLTISGAANFNGGALAAYLNGSLLVGSSGNVVNLYAQSSGLHIKNNTGTFPLLTVNNSGDYTFQDGAGGTRMTLNSSGLGVGGSPAAKLTIFAGADGDVGFFRGGSTRQLQIGTSATAGYLNADNGSAGFELRINGTARAYFDTSGNVGIGGSPSTRLHVVGGNARINDGFQLEFGGTTNSIAGSNANNTMNIYTNNVLRVSAKANGQVRFIPLAADPAGAEAGDVYYNSTSNKLKCYNGTTWNDLF